MSKCLRESRPYLSQPSLKYFPLESIATLYYRAERNLETTASNPFNVERAGISIQSGAPAATQFASPINTFNAGATTRGLVSTTSGMFEISGLPSPEFGELNATYPGIFQPFSAPRLFSPLGTDVMDANFFVPGTSTRASVFGFGAVFTDVDLANTSSLEFFDLANQSLGTFFVPTFNNGLSFLGVTFTDAIGRVRITTGNTALGPNDGGATDVVALDDFIYSEPQAAAVPEPATPTLLGMGVAAIVARARRRRLSGS